MYFQELVIYNALVKYDSQSNTFQARYMQNGDLFEIYMHELNIMYQIL